VSLRRRIPLRLPTWLCILLLPVVFLGGCLLSYPFIWDWQEHDLIRPVGDPGAGVPFFPVLIRTTAGKYDIARLDATLVDATIVSSVTRGDEARINRDLVSEGDYRYFRILSEGPGPTRVSLEIWSGSDRKIQTWYSLSTSGVIPEKVLTCHTDAFSLVVGLWSCLPAAACVALYLILVRPKDPYSLR
jgi:hypothetical protein